MLVLVLDSSLGLSDLQAMSQVNTFHDKVVPEMNRVLLLDWKPLLEPYLDYENQVAIDTNPVDMGTFLAPRSGLDPGRVARTLGGEYTGARRDVDTILYEIQSVVNLEDYPHVKKILTKGFPSEVTSYEPRVNKLKTINRGNHNNVLDNPELGNNIINEEYQYFHLNPLHNWVCTLDPHL